MAGNYKRYTIDNARFADSVGENVPIESIKYDFAPDPRPRAVGVEPALIFVWDDIQKILRVRPIVSNTLSSLITSGYNEISVLECDIINKKIFIGYEDSAVPGDYYIDAANYDPDNGTLSNRTAVYGPISNKITSMRPDQTNQLLYFATGANKGYRMEYNGDNVTLFSTAAHSPHGGFDFDDDNNDLWWGTAGSEGLIVISDMDALPYWGATTVCTHGTSTADRIEGIKVDIDHDFLFYGGESFLGIYIASGFGTATPVSSTLMFSVSRYLRTAFDIDRVNQYLYVVDNSAGNIYRYTYSNGMAEDQTDMGLLPNTTHTHIALG